MARGARSRRALTVRRGDAQAPMASTVTSKSGLSGHADVQVALALRGLVVTDNNFCERRHEPRRSAN